jgi:hypothetical protein
VVNLSEFSLFRLLREDQSTEFVKQSLINLYSNQFHIEEKVTKVASIDESVQLNHTFDMFLQNEQEVVALDFSMTKPNERHYQGAIFILEQIKEHMNLPNMRYLLFDLNEKRWETMDYKGKDWVIQKFEHEKIPNKFEPNTFEAAK